MSKPKILTRDDWTPAMKITYNIGVSDGAARERRELSRYINLWENQPIPPIALKDWLASRKGKK